MARVFVAMSGGVDSSVAAALLVEQGHEVTGVTMQLWPSGDDEGGCCSVTAVRDAHRVCDLLGIPHYALNFRESFESAVVERFAREYADGRTPNPCVVCNDVVKFGDLLHRVSLQGADALATGHYARVIDEGGRRALARGVDSEKDQSYFLYRMSDEQLERVMFPVGGLRKTDVRDVATRLGLSVAEKPDSQEACFASEGDYAPVIAARAPEALVDGDIVDCDGNVIGRHHGIARYTIGQRRGLGIGGPDPLFVLRLDAGGNRVVVGPRESLQSTVVEASEIVWHAGDRETVEAVVRYRMRPVRGIASVSAGTLRVDFDEPVESVAPGQSLVCYRGDVVLGGGVITCAS